MFGPSPLEVAGVEPAIGAIAVHLGIVGPHAKRPIIVVEGLGPKAHPAERHAEVLERIGRRRIPADGLSQVSDRLVEPAEIRQHHAQIHPDVDRVGIEREGLAIALGGLGLPALIPHGQAQIIPEYRVVGAELDRAGEERLGLRRPALLPQARTELVQQARTVGAQTQGLAQQRLGFGISALSHQRGGVRSVHVGRIGADQIRPTPRGRLTASRTIQDPIHDRCLPFRSWTPKSKSRSAQSSKPKLVTATPVEPYFLRDSRPASRRRPLHDESASLLRVRIHVLGLHGRFEGLS